MCCPRVKTTYLDEKKLNHLNQINFIYCLYLPLKNRVDQKNILGSILLHGRVLELIRIIDSTA